MTHPQDSVQAFVNPILEKCIRSNATDIHFQIDNSQLRIQYRQHGALETLPPAPSHLAQSAISYIKSLANLNITHTFKPQDGVLHYRLEGKTVSFRVAVAPSTNGETLVLRILGANSIISQSIDSLNFPVETTSSLRKAIQSPNGIILTVGPTGSGKTTTTYACLNEINEVHKKIITVEDPIEYPIEGLTQVSVDSASNRTFPSILRSVLRHDPDILFVGEIRDSETAQIAFQAALTGHLVLSTLHASSIDATIPRLLDLGIEPYQIEESLRAILFQRLATSNARTQPLGQFQWVDDAFCAKIRDYSPKSKLSLLHS